MDALERQRLSNKMLSERLAHRDREEPSPHFCMDCGAKTVAFLPNQSDDYEGDSFRCTTCGFSWRALNQLRRIR